MRKKNCWKRDVINICLLILFHSCGYSNADSKNEVNSSVILPSQKEVNLITKDTISFDKLSDLITYFQKKINDAEAAKLKANKAKKLNEQLSIDSLQYLDSSYYGLIKERSNSIYEFLEKKRNSNENFDALKYLIIDWTFSSSLIDSIFRQFPASLRNSADGKWMLNRIKKRKVKESLSTYNLSILDLQLYNTENKKVSLKEITSQYILLDFWASWCSPCRYENRVLRKKKFLIEGEDYITIVAISLDNDKGKWQKASKTDSLNYLNFCDYKAFDSPLAKEFKVTGIPYNVIIDKNGRILGSNLWGDRLTKFVKSMAK